MHICNKSRLMRICWILRCGSDTMGTKKTNTWKKTSKWKKFKFIMFIIGVCTFFVASLAFTILDLQLRFTGNSVMGQVIDVQRVRGSSRRHRYRTELTVRYEANGRVFTRAMTRPMFTGTPQRYAEIQLFYDPRRPHMPVPAGQIYTWLVSLVICGSTIVGVWCRGITPADLR